MEIDQLVVPQCVRQGARVPSRKRALDLAVDLIAERYDQVVARPLFDALMEREKLGSTGIGEGVAIPHCRLNCAGIMAALLCLDQPVDYDAPDGKPVDLIFVLVVPNEENDAHLQLLSLVAAVFAHAANRARLRQARSSGALAAEFLNAAKRECGQRHLT